MIAWTSQGWTGDVLDWKAREQLLVRRDVIWENGEVRFCGLDREWLRELGVLG